MTRQAHQPVTVLELASQGGHLRLQLAVRGGGLVVIAVPVGEVAGYLLPHVHALHGHAQGCRGRTDVHVDLLLRCCRLLGSGSQRLVVRDGEAPAFWLEVETASGDRAHLDLGVLDAVVLLASRRVPVALEAPAAGCPAPSGVKAGDWDAALQALLQDGS